MLSFLKPPSIFCKVEDRSPTDIPAGAQLRESKPSQYVDIAPDFRSITLRGEGVDYTYQIGPGATSPLDAVGHLLFFLHRKVAALESRGPIA